MGDPPEVLPAGRAHDDANSNWHKLPVARIAAAFVYGAWFVLLSERFLLHLHDISTGVVASAGAFVLVSAMFVVALWDGFIAPPGAYFARWKPPGWLVAAAMLAAFGGGLYFGATFW